MTMIYMIKMITVILRRKKIFLGSVGELCTPACRSKNDTVILIRPLGAIASCLRFRFG